jgi:uncharacterized spore protein YtfJ
MEKNHGAFDNTLNSLFQGMEGFISTKTVVGEAIHIGDTIIVPLVNVSFGVAAGAFRNEGKNNTGGGMGGKLTPSAVLVIHNGNTRMISVDRNSYVEKILDMVPDFVDKFADRSYDKKQDEPARQKAAKEMEDIITDAVNVRETAAEDEDVSAKENPVNNH